MGRFGPAGCHRPSNNASGEVSSPPVSRALQLLQPFVLNPLPIAPGPRAWATGLIGDHPSTYSRSPRIWNAAFRELGLDAVYAPFDVDPEGLPELVEAIRRESRFLGMNVTVPYKQAIIPLIDGVDVRAACLDAVNTVVRTPDGELLGFNTDGEGAFGSLTLAWPGQPQPFLPSLDRLSVLLIGAGGAASAVAFTLAEAVGPRGRLFIANRTPETALALGQRVAAAFGNAQGLDEADADLLAPGVDLIVNASTRGQAGAKVARLGKVAYLEPYSALAPAAPPSIDDQEDEPEIARLQRWFATATGSIEENHALSMQFTTHVPRHAAFFDLVYAPPETTTLRHARWSGHPTLNGQGMIVFQAVAAFVDHIARPLLEEAGFDASIREQVVETMALNWGA
jgi:shikimate dehydrogenase